VYLAKKRRVAGGRAVEGSEIVEERHAGRAMLLSKELYGRHKFIDCVRAPFDPITVSHIDIGNMGHLIWLHVN